MTNLVSRWIVLLFAIFCVHASAKESEEWWSVSTLITQLKRPSGIRGLPPRFEVCMSQRDSLRARDELHRLLTAQFLAGQLVRTDERMRHVTLAYKGLGLVFIPPGGTQEDFVIAGTHAGSPASAMDFFHTDMVLLSVNGTAVHGLSDDQVMHLLRVESPHVRGVTVEVRRWEGGRTFTRFIPRAHIVTRTVVPCFIMSKS